MTAKARRSIKNESENEDKMINISTDNAPASYADIVGGDRVARIDGPVDDQYLAEQAKPDAPGPRGPAASGTF